MWESDPQNSKGPSFKSVNLIPHMLLLEGMLCQKTSQVNSNRYMKLRIPGTAQSCQHTHVSVARMEAPEGGNAPQPNQAVDPLQLYQPEVLQNIFAQITQVQEQKQQEKLQRKREKRGRGGGFHKGSSPQLGS